MTNRCIVFLILSLSTAWAFAESGREDYDLDNDGLIEINDIADLDEVRRNLDGSTLYGVSTGCPAAGCDGFELSTDVDFDTNGNAQLDVNDFSWRGGKGWLPIGDSREPFAAVFEGNGHRLNGMVISRPDSDFVGLFGVVEGATIRHLSLGGGLTVDCSSRCGALAGHAENTSISNVFVSRTISISAPSGNYVGGLIGYLSDSDIESSYAVSRLYARSTAGGLVGRAVSSRIVRSYAGGNLSAHSGTIGGLAGALAEDTFVITSYASTQLQTSEESFDGLVAALSYADSDVTIEGSYSTGYLTGPRANRKAYSGRAVARSSTNSYWVTAEAPSESNGRTLEELKCPVAANDNSCADGVSLYQGWDDYQNEFEELYWDFGTNEDLPALKLNGNFIRDNDGDGYPETYDAFPGNEAAYRDSDGDGAVDAWSFNCDENCIANSGLVLDEFPHLVAASVDDDLDGLPDEWNAECDIICQQSSGLTLDNHLNDYDNDGLNDSEDEDSDGDGLVDSDRDSNGLVEIVDLEGIDNIRFSPRGYGRKERSSGGLDSSGCPPRIHRGTSHRVCFGYELKADLDFDTNRNGQFDSGDDYWNYGSGWQPIYGEGLDVPSSFQGVFEGNGHLIKNLSINRPDQHSVGLFGELRGAVMRRFGLVGKTKIHAYYSAGAIAGSASSSEIFGVFSTIGVSGEGGLGGLVGNLDNSSLTATYVHADVASNSLRFGEAKGLFCYGSSNDVSASYFVGTLKPKKTFDVLGHIYKMNQPSYYWANNFVEDISSIPPQGIFGLALNELKCVSQSGRSACTKLDTFPDWESVKDSSGVNVWSFGTDKQLPALNLNNRVVRDSDGDGVVDEDDQFPNSYAAWSDSDNDGYPDAISLGCDDKCLMEQNLNLDQFPRDPSYSKDLDLDGLPDQFNAQCSKDCREDSLLALDPLLNDSDNDGITNTQDSDDDNAGSLDVDANGNGLVDISTLQHLDAIRNQVDGAGLRLAVDGRLDSSGCPVVWSRGKYQRLCWGYELVKDLDFDSNDDGLIDEMDEFWRDGKGWDPIGGNNIYFSATFEGNGHLIRNLRIANESDYYMGLFRGVRGAEIRNLGFTGEYLKVAGGGPVAFLTAHARDSLFSGVFVVGGELASFENGGAGAIVGFGSNVVIKNAFSTGITFSKGPEFNGLHDSMIDSLIENSYSISFPHERVTAGGSLKSYYSISIENSYWVDTIHGPVEDGHNASLRDLSCYQSGSDEACESNLDIRAWSAFPASTVGAWRFGSGLQLPGLFFDEITYRDSDADGILDTEDALLYDHDNDGTDDQLDRFPLLRQASVDDDMDGLPDSWNSGCDLECRKQSGLQIDLNLNDSDNDGVDNPIDGFSYNPSAAVDGDNDGFPDSWLSGCDQACREDSELIYDLYPNDSDNDGIENGDDYYPYDPGRSSDTSAPAIAEGPADIKVNEQGDITKVIIDVDAFDLKDNFDSDPDLELFIDDVRQELDQDNSVYLPTGRSTLNWISIDKSGNRSEAFDQVVDIFPEVGFDQSSIISGEGSSFDVIVAFSGPMPNFPAELVVRLLSDESTVDLEDIDMMSAVEEGAFVVDLEGRNQESSGLFRVTMVEDEALEGGDVLTLELLSVIHGSEDAFPLAIDGDRKVLSVTITERNLAPEVSMTVFQGGGQVSEIDVDKGEVTLAAMVADRNGKDQHQIEWYIPFINSPVAFGREVVLDPSSIGAGQYEVTLQATDNGAPVKSSGERVFKLNVVDNNTLEPKPKPKPKPKPEPAPTPDPVEVPNSPEGNSGGAGGGQSQALLMLLLAMLMVSVRSRR